MKNIFGYYRICILEDSEAWRLICCSMVCRVGNVGPAAVDGGGAGGLFTPGSGLYDLGFRAQGLGLTYGKGVLGLEAEKKAQGPLFKQT